MQSTDAALEDYAALLGAATAFAWAGAYDRTGRRFWSTGDAEPAGLPEAVAAFLGAPSPTAGRTEFAGDGHWLLHGLTGQRGRSLGVLVVAGKPGAAPPDPAALGPAMRTLERELGLRMRLVEAQKKLAIHAAEEALLHQVEMLLQERLDCERALARVLELAVEHLGIRRAGLDVPDKGIRLLRGTRARVLDPRRLEALLRPNPSADPGAEGPIVRALDGAAAGGWLVLDGWSQSGFSRPRRRRVARYLASHVATLLGRDFDALTGLLQWPAFAARIDDLPTGSQPPQVVFCNVDRLHVINENLGRGVGDQLLARLARLLKRHFPAGTATRVSGDTFAVVVADAAAEPVVERARALCSRVSEIEYATDGRTLRASISVGVAPLAEAEEGGGLALAQLACQAAKERGRGRVEIYAPCDASIVRRFDDIHLVGRIRSAIQQDQLVLLGQPIARLRGPGPAQARYFEVLVRILDDGGRQMLPAEFLSSAERYQLMEELDRWVVGRSLEMLAGAGGGELPRLAINLSGQSLGSEEFLPFVLERVRASGVAPDRLCFEITESVAVANIQRAQHFMRALQRLGCRFSLDDFGTGLSSFGYLKLFPVDTVKIDGSFISDIAVNPVSQSVVAAIAEFARVMGLETIAEYVQDEGALTLLGDLGVGWGQGYLFGSPAPLEDCLAAATAPPQRERAAGSR